MKKDKIDLLLPDYSPPADFSPTSMPVNIPNQINSFYKVLSDDLRPLFVRVVRSIYKEVNSRKSHIFALYWLVNMSRFKLGLTMPHFLLLSYLYFITWRGVRVVSSFDVINSGCLPDVASKSYQPYLTGLKIKGFISRSHRDSSRPYLQAGRSRHPIFITLTDKGIKFMDDINREISNTLMRCTVEEIAGIKK